MRYRVGKFGWKLAFHLGIPLYFRYFIRQDLRVNVFIATSPDIKGLTVECDKLADVKPIVLDCAKSLLLEQLHPSFDYLQRDHEQDFGKKIVLKGYAGFAREIYS